VSVMATGMTGVIGRHLHGLAIPLKVDLAAIEKSNIVSKFRGGQNLIHLAGIVGEQKVTSNKEYSYSVNVSGAEALAERFHKHGTGVFIYISSSHVYKPSIKQLTENSEVGPTSNYAIQKLEAELKVGSVFKDDPERLVIVRLFSILGDGMPDFSLGGAIRRLSDDKQFVIHNCDDVRDFLSPTVAARCIVDIAQSKKVHGTYNLCSGNAQTIKEAVLSRISPTLHDEVKPRLLSGNSGNPSIIGSNSKLLDQIPSLRNMLNENT
jgi:nucleoside-diphosphate-sugar epimerase